MKRIIFLSDILSHSIGPSYVTSHSWLADILNPAVSMACGSNIQQFFNLKNKQGELFDRVKFFALSGIYDISVTYYLYDISSIKKDSWDYLFSFITKDDLIIGIELAQDLRRELSKSDITYINFWFHSFHLFDDICFALNTNNTVIFERIKKYQIPREKFELYAAIAKIKLKKEAYALSSRLNLPPRCIFIGQCMQDRSVVKDGCFLNITHFSEEIERLGKEYGTIHYIPHPHDPVENHPQLVEFIQARPYIRILKNIPSYVLLCFPHVEMVVGISSSLLYEAQFFDKKTQYLYRPLFDIDKDFGENCFLSVYNDYLNPAFWIDVLDGFFDTNKSAQNVKLFDDRQSMLRGEIIDNYHAYRSLDKFAKLQNEMALVRNKLESTKGLKYIFSKLFKRTNDPQQDVSVRYFFGFPIYKRCGKNIQIFWLPVKREKKKA